MTKLKKKLQIQNTLATMTEAEPPKRERHQESTKIKGGDSQNKISINSCTMSSPVDQTFNNVIQIAKATEAEMLPPNIQDDEGTTQVESSGSSSQGSTSDYEPTAEVLLTQSIIRNPQLLQMAAALFEYRTARDMNQLPPTSPTLSEAPSTTTTENLYPSWPYAIHTDLDYDLSPEQYERPYLAAIMNPINGDP